MLSAHNLALSMVSFSKCLLCIALRTCLLSIAFRSCLFSHLTIAVYFMASLTKLASASFHFKLIPITSLTPSRTQSNASLTCVLPGSAVLFRPLVALTRHSPLLNVTISFTHDTAFHHFAYFCTSLIFPHTYTRSPTRHVATPRISLPTCMHMLFRPSCASHAFSIL